LKGFESPSQRKTFSAYKSVGAFAPLLAAATLIFRKDRWAGVKTFLRQVFDFRAKPIYYAVALLLPIAIHLIPHYLAPALGFEVANTLFPAEIPVSPIIFAIPYFFLMLLIGGGQEEFGWRGYAQQPLQEKIGIIPASLLIGFVWGLWHLPLWVMPGVGNSTYPFPAFLMMTTSISLVYAWIFNKSGQKLILVILFHAMNNTAAPLIPFLHAQAGKPETAYWVYAGVNVLVGIIFAVLINKETKSKLIK